MSKENKVSVNIGFPLTTLFVILKMVGVINWSWLWVLAPTWIPFLIGVCFLVLALFAHILAATLK